MGCDWIVDILNLMQLDIISTFHLSIVLLQRLLNNMLNTHVKHCKLLTLTHPGSILPVLLSITLSAVLYTYTQLSPSLFNLLMDAMAEMVM